jgi:DNA-binding transcriptional ArsR family regulator
MATERPSMRKIREILRLKGRRRALGVSRPAARCTESRRSLIAEPSGGVTAARALDLGTLGIRRHVSWRLQATGLGCHELSHARIVDRLGARLPDLRKRPELLRLQLLALFGNTARAEVLLVFITARRSPGPLLSASDLVATRYTKRNVAFVLADLAQAGLLSERKVGNQVRYRLEQRAELTKLVPGAQSAILTRWDLRFRTLAAARRLFAATEKKSLTIRSIEARRFVTDLSDTWQVLDLTPPAPEEPTKYWGDLAAWIDQTLVPQQLLELTNRHPRPGAEDMRRALPALVVALCLSAPARAGSPDVLDCQTW